MLLVSRSAVAEDPDIARLFVEHGLNGTLVLSSLQTDQTFIHNRERAQQRRSLPFAPSAYDALRRIMRVEQTPAFTLRAKTGWATRATPAIGWYVGTVETPTETWVFATNLDMTDEQALSWRQRLTREALQVKGIVQ